MLTHSGTTSPNPDFAGVRVLFYFTFIYELLVYLYPDSHFSRISLRTYGSLHVKYSSYVKLKEWLGQKIQYHYF